MRGTCVQYIDNMPVISLVDSPMQGFNLLLKRIEDLSLAIFFITILSPIMMVIALIIKMTTKGPVIFTQWRYGLDGKPIKVWKFCTMTVFEDGYSINAATNNDKRVTRVGKILRKLSLDELPQFFNVLYGDLSIVGPRPHAISEVEKYRTKIYGSMLRHKIKPGITGLAQIYGTRGEVDTKEKLEKRIYYDLQYIQKWSIWLDLKIIFFTSITLFDIKREVV
jgi:putative colanic acid biosynthesis UDP-glucose lipid carrier transferase